MSVTAAAGFRAAGVWAGVKGSGKLDVSVVASDRPASAAGVFTVNRFRSPSVALTETRLRATGGRARAIVTVSGCANAMTGAAGLADARRITAVAARRLRVPAAQVLFASTGPIGPRLPVSRVARGLSRACGALSATPAAGLAAARGILTTDTRPKQAATQFADGGVRYTVGGMAKGAGMAAPEMATVLACVTTDAAVAPGPLRRALREAVAPTLNAITVDGQMSTNDTGLVLANGAAARRPLSSRGLARFRDALREVLGALARELIADGEGAGRLIRVTVRRARTAADARTAARAIADSALVKTMFHGRQANWGRIAQALGACRAAFEPNRVAIRVGGVPAVRGGRVLPATSAAFGALAESEVSVDVDLAAGDGPDVRPDRAVREDQRRLPELAPWAAP
jgi:glutamate N-acetyltransferase/amino-acid N-acetyltransferase